MTIVLYIVAGIGVVTLLCLAVCCMAVIPSRKTLGRK